MKKRGKKFFSVVLLIFALTGCMSCAGKEAGDTETEDNGRQEDIQPQENAEEADDTRGADDTQDAENAQDAESAQTDDEDTIPGKEREAEVVWGEAFINDRAPDVAPFDLLPVLAYEEWDKEKTQVEAPRGILFDGEGLLVCDTKNNCVVRLTTEGDYVESYGERGGESGNFKDPTAILLHENEVYVLDSGNRRIQVFDLEMNYVREIEFAGSARKYIDMAISGDGTIFLSTGNDSGERSYLSYIGEDGVLQIVTGWFYGYLAEEDGIVYAVDTGFFWREGEDTGLASGEDWFYRVDKSGLEKIFELPYMYETFDFLVEDGCLYAVSGTCGRLIRFSPEGELEEALMHREGARAGGAVDWPCSYLCRQDEDTFYVTYGEGYICKTVRAEGEQ